MTLLPMRFDAIASSVRVIIGGSRLRAPAVAAVRHWPRQLAVTIGELVLPCGCTCAGEQRMMKSGVSQIANCNLQNIACF